MKKQYLDGRLRLELSLSFGLLCSITVPLCSKTTPAPSIWLAHHSGLTETPLHTCKMCLLPACVKVARKSPAVSFLTLLSCQRSVFFLFPFVHSVMNCHRRLTNTVPNPKHKHVLVILRGPAMQMIFRFSGSVTNYWRMFVVLQPPSKDVAPCHFHEPWDFDPAYYYRFLRKLLMRISFLYFWYGCFYLLNLWHVMAWR